MGSLHAHAHSFEGRIMSFRNSCVKRVKKCVKKKTIKRMTSITTLHWVVFLGKATETKKLGGITLDTARRYIWRTVCVNGLRTGLVSLDCAETFRVPLSNQRVESYKLMNGIFWLLFPFSASHKRLRTCLQCYTARRALEPDCDCEGLGLQRSRSNKGPPFLFWNISEVLCDKMAHTVISVNLPPHIDPTKSRIAYGDRALPKLVSCDYFILK